MEYRVIANVHSRGLADDGQRWQHRKHEISPLIPEGKLIKSTGKAAGEKTTCKSNPSDLILDRFDALTTTC
jgi:hypothetical protein